MVACPRPHEYARIFREHPIQVIVGSGKRSYFVHPGALSWCNTSALNARVSGPWKENGAGGPFDWTDFDEQTIECVLSYLYTQDYCVPDSASDQHGIYLNTDDTKVNTSVEPISVVAEPPPFNTGSADIPTLDRPLTPLSRCLRVGLPAETSQTAAGGITKRKLQNSEHNPAVDILLHAKVYCFAHRFLIPDLESFALQRLTQVLLIVDTQKYSLFPYLADAIRLVYDSTPSAQLQDNPARKLLSQYVALKYTELATEKLTKLLEEGGEFPTDLSHKLVRRITASETGAQSLEEQIDGLQIKVDELEASYQEKESQLQKARDELVEWESWDRVIPEKYKKAKRRLGHNTLPWDV
ncbi:hypothetical protein BDV37DRAFT_270132 [Aspergillus pseudonomiae]|uniref:BTB domain-containing protein n=1 Tax=Aspergillus pseudonomiae TaxID=1506151 RepID=A0A5N7DIF8_9EURO|nr:uncharacterized protein BDV37DRAFT_270132 [Aspergillus pseudonomiae]KAE8406231.1 hypothetical protein BDV37DRAFT_270132 [Aspergillus pseudonomiae]